MRRTFPRFRLPVITKPARFHFSVRHYWSFRGGGCHKQRKAAGCNRRNHTWPVLHRWCSRKYVYLSRSLPSISNHSSVYHEVESGDSIASEGKGDYLFVEGRVLDLQGNPIPGAIINTWEADSSGLYDTQVRLKKFQKDFVKFNAHPHLD